VVCCVCSDRASLSSFTSPRTSPTCFAASSDMAAGAVGFGLEGAETLCRTWMLPRFGDVLYEPPVCEINTLSAITTISGTYCAYKIRHDLRYLLSSNLLVTRLDSQSLRLRLPG